MPIILAGKADRSSQNSGFRIQSLLLSACVRHGVELSDNLTELTREERYKIFGSKTMVIGTL